MNGHPTPWSLNEACVEQLGELKWLIRVLDANGRVCMQSMGFAEDDPGYRRQQKCLLERIVACVNAMADINAPVAFMRRARKAAPYFDWFEGLT